MLEVGRAKPKPGTVQGNLVPRKRPGPWQGPRAGNKRSAQKWPSLDSGQLKSRHATVQRWQEEEPDSKPKVPASGGARRPAGPGSCFHTPDKDLISGKPCGSRPLRTQGHHSLSPSNLTRSDRWEGVLVLKFSLLRESHRTKVKKH